MASAHAAQALGGSRPAAGCRVTPQMVKLRAARYRDDVLAPADSAGALHHRYGFAVRLDHAQGSAPPSG